LFARRRNRAKLSINSRMFEPELTVAAQNEGLGFRQCLKSDHISVDLFARRRNGAKFSV
jgi:hypothetical protein